MLCLPAFLSAPAPAALAPSALARAARLALALAAGLGLAAPAAGWEASEAVRLEVLPGWRGEDGQQVAALRLVLAEGWKTYWRAPGDAGIPPRFDFSASRNVATVQPLWPVPEIDWDNGLRTLVYHGQLVLPLRVGLRGPGPAHLAGEIEIGVCDEICVPVTLGFAADLPEDGGRDGVIMAALSERPLTASEAGVGTVRCRLTPVEDGLMVEAQVALAVLGPQETAAIEAGDPAIWVSQPQVARQGGLLTLAALMASANGQPVAVDRSALRLTLFGGGSAVDIIGCPAG